MKVFQNVYLERNNAPLILKEKKQRKVAPKLTNNIDEVIKDPVYITKIKHYIDLYEKNYPQS